MSIGDFRMIVGEDKNKVRNIVSPHLDQFDHLYHDSLNTDYLFIGEQNITQVIIMTLSTVLSIFQ